MNLTAEEQAILQGEQGETLRKVLQSVVTYGEAFGAERLVPIEGASHMVTSFGANVIQPYFEMVDECIAAGLRCGDPFTMDPRPPVGQHKIPCSWLEGLAFRLIYSRQQPYEAQLAQLGLRDDQAFSCTCYLPEVGNIPRRGAALAWSESSAVVYANSVLGARTNRNSGGIDLLCSIAGKVPLFGLLTDAGRRATWLVEVRTSGRPHAQVLGSAIGMRVVEEVPYIVGLERFFEGLDEGSSSYLKDMGAAAASNGAVGLYHVEGITPEAVEQGRELLAEGYRTYVVDDAELARVMGSYPVLWKDPNARPRRCFVGCPHLSLPQLRWWAGQIPQALEAQGRDRVALDTVLCAAPEVLQRFGEDGEAYERALAAGLTFSSICPLMFMNNPLAARKPVVTNSNKLRTYSTARFFPDEEVLEIVVRGTVPGGAR